MHSSNIVKLQTLRQRTDMFHQTFQRKLLVTGDLVKRLGLECELEGHTGCVNCLQWNDAGELLASGSDDLNIMIWTPFLKKKCHIISSGHHGNIFSVKFVPGTSDNCIVSGAADFKIRVNNLKSNEVNLSCSCHGGRVKRLATSPNVPYMFWSAAEDGIIMQFDLRSPHQCSNVCNNVLVNLVNHLGRTAEAKCIAINPCNPNLLAVGANDPYVRMYDRRMIKPTTAKFSNDRGSSIWNLLFTGEPVEPGDDNLPPGCVSYFVAGHLPQKQNEFRRRYRSLTATYVTFSPDGKDLLVNLGGEQIYLFNIMSKRNQLVFDMCAKALNFNYNAIENGEDLKIHCCDEFRVSKNKAYDIPSNETDSTSVTHSPSCLHNNIVTASSSSQHNPVQKGIHFLPGDVEQVRKCANHSFERQEYTVAISLYSSAIVMCPSAACLYGNRAAAYIKRGWDGDIYAAIRDCCTSIDLDPDYLKVHFRLAQCLRKMGWAKEAYDCLQALRIKYPVFAAFAAFEALENDVRMGIFSEMSEVDNGENESEDDASSTTSGNSSIRSFTYIPSGVSDQEKEWRTSAYDYEYRYCGHCNTTTDIKEANFLGSYGEYIVAGSDDGSIFIWDRATTNIVRVLRGDDSIVNCLQPHPSTCMLATSGIDPVVRLWSPRAEDGTIDDREILDRDDVATANQRRMNADPLEIMLINMGYRLPGVLGRMTENRETETGPGSIVQCRTS